MIKFLFSSICIYFLTVSNLVAQVLDSRNGSLLEIYFTQRVNTRYTNDQTPPFWDGGEVVMTKIISFINEAKSTLDIAMYNNNRSQIIDALNDAVLRGVRVRYLTDREQTNSALNGNTLFHIFFAKNNDGIMHNKFIVIDAAHPEDAAIMTGSANFTDNGLYSDANNLLFIQSQSLAQIYTTEFNEMWGSEVLIPGDTPKAGKNKQDNTLHWTTVDQIPMEVYFSPSDNTEDKIINALGSADHSIRIGMNLFTSDGLANILVSEHEDNIDIKGITDNNSSQTETAYLQSKGIDIVDHAPSPLLHHKYAIIDADYSTSDPQIVTGSHNWTWSANNINDENTLIIHDHAIAELFQAEFYSRYCELKPNSCNALSSARIDLQNINIYPTLVANELKLDDINFECPSISFQIIDQHGRPIYYRQNKMHVPLENIDCSQFPSGVYFLKVICSEEFKIMKFIKI